MFPWIFITAGVLLISSCSATITKDEFNNVLFAYDAPEPDDERIYNYLSDDTEDFSREEMAMLLAQLVYESDGFQFTEESHCVVAADHCANRYKDRVGLKNKAYYGRGYIMLKYGANYLEASKALGRGKDLLYHPEKVASDVDIAVLTATWYWKTKVRAALKGRENMFGLSTNAINPNDCKNNHESKVRAQKRWDAYLTVALVLNIQNRALEGGCY